MTLEHLHLEEPREYNPLTRIPFQNRMPFQMKVFSLLEVEHNLDKAGDLSEILSKLIDNPNNATIRQLVMSEKYEEAAKWTIKHLRDTGEFDF